MLTEIFDQTLEFFLKSESKNLLSGVSERNLCSRFSMYLERIAHEKGLIGYYADSEYNRKQNGEVKTILDDNMHVISITCDIILHSRGEIIGRDNLIAIEMKKVERSEEEKIKDRARLRALTKSSFDEIWSNDGKTHPEHVCGYEEGYFLELNREERSYVVQQFQSGELTNQLDGKITH